MDTLSAFVLLFLVMDPLGGVPLFLSALKHVKAGRRMWVVLRECGFAFVALLFFLLFGRQFMALLQVSQSSLGIAGGLILFIIALKIIFSASENIFGDSPEGEPFLVPLAIPLLAGPSAFATVILLASRYPKQMPQWIGVLCLAVAASAVILASSGVLIRVLGQRGIAAFERLIGLILTTVAVEMFLTGIREFAKGL